MQNKKTTAKRIATIAGMTAVTLFLFLTVNLLFMPKYIEENLDGRITSEFYREKTNSDILFVGSSTVFSAINPIVLWEEYGMTAFDRANASQTSWISYFMIKDAIEVSDPKMVVLDLSFFRYEDDYVEEAGNRKALDGMRVSKTKYQCIQAAKSPDETYKDYVFPIGRFHSRWQYLTAEDWKYLYVKPTVSYNGYLPSYEIESAEGERNDTSDDSYMSDRNALFLENIITICRDNGIQLMLIKVPSYRPKWGEVFENDVRMIADSNGVEYVDFDKKEAEIGIDYSIDTDDGGGHLNDAGAAKFTKYLGEYLKQHYEVSDHRNDPAYNTIWNQKCERYHNGQQ